MLMNQRLNFCLRIRRIKCDEAKPPCQRCTSTGRKCDGYAMAVSKTQKPSSSAAQLSSLSPSTGSPAERQALYMFRTRIAKSIASSVDLGFWTYDLLQTAEAYQTVQHAVAALAAAYHSSILSEHGHQMQESRFILTQYTKSINSLQNCLSMPELLTKGQQVVILMTNLVFICICAVQGSREEACLHLKNGLSLLHEWQFGVEEGRGSEITPTPVKLLATVYTQLDTQARVIIDSISPHRIALWRPHAVTLDGWGSGHLRVVTQAVSQLERLHNESIQIATALRRDEDEPHRRSRLIEESCRELRAWDSNFSWLWSSPGHKNNSIKALQMWRLLAGANLEVLLQTTGSGLECSQTRANGILKLAHDMAQESMIPGLGVFSPAGGLVEALYFVAARCQDAYCKREAINLLKRYPMIEGLWDASTACAALTEDTME